MDRLASLVARLYLQAVPYSLPYIKEDYPDYRDESDTKSIHDVDHSDDLAKHRPDPSDNDLILIGPSGYVTPHVPSDAIRR